MPKSWIKPPSFLPFYPPTIELTPFDTLSLYHHHRRNIFKCGIIVCIELKHINRNTVISPLHECNVILRYNALPSLSLILINNFIPILMGYLEVMALQIKVFPWEMPCYSLGTEKTTVHISTETLKAFALYRTIMRLFWLLHFLYLDTIG